MTRTSFPHISSIGRSIASLFLVCALFVCANCACDVVALGSKATDSHCHHEGGDDGTSSPNSKVPKCCTGQVTSFEKSFFYKKERHTEGAPQWFPPTTIQLDKAERLSSISSSAPISLVSISFSNRRVSISAPRGPPLVQS